MIRTNNTPTLFNDLDRGIQSLTEQPRFTEAEKELIQTKCSKIIAWKSPSIELLRQVCLVEQAILSLSLQRGFQTSEEEKAYKDFYAERVATPACIYQEISKAFESSLERDYLGQEERSNWQKREGLEALNRLGLAKMQARYILLEIENPDPKWQASYNNYDSSIEQVNSVSFALRNSFSESSPPGPSEGWRKIYKRMG